MLCRNAQEWKSHVSAQDPAIQTVTFRPHHKSITMSSLVAHQNCRQKYQEEISNFLILCCHNFKHIHGQQLCYSHPAPKATTRRLNPGPSRLKSTTQAGSSLSLSRKALSGDAGSLPKSLPWSHSPIYLPHISNRMYVLGSSK